MFEVREKPRLVESAYLLSVIKREDERVGAESLLEELEELVRDYDIDQLVFTPSTLSLSLEQLGPDTGVGNLRISMVPISFVETVSQRAADEDGPLPLIDLREGR